MDDRERGHEEEFGQKGGSAEAHLGAAAYPIAEPLATYIGRVRWGAVAAGTVIAIATMMLLTSLGIAIGLSFGRFGGGGGLAYWVIGSATIGLFVGGLLASRFGNVASLWTAILHGVTVWSVFMILDRLGVDLIGGISRLMLLGAAGAPGTTSVISTAGWWFFIGYLIALVGAILGSVAGLAGEEAEREHHVHT